MEIPCEKCQSTFRVDSRLIKPSGTKVRCSKCQHVFRIHPTNEVERRKDPRIKTSNLISLLSIDENGKEISQGLGRALDISKGGMLLETPHPIPEARLSLMAVDKDNILFEIEAKLAYCKKSAPELYQSGIRFIGTEEQVISYVTRLIKEYNSRKSTLHVALPKVKSKVA